MDNNLPLALVIILLVGLLALGAVMLRNRRARTQKRRHEVILFSDPRKRGGR